MKFTISSAFLLAAVLVAAPEDVLANNSSTCELAGCKQAPAKDLNKNATAGGNAYTVKVVPQVLVHEQSAVQPHLQAIQEYLANPAQQLQQIDLVDTLDDLEDELIDMDEAREFYELGGWPLLTSLVAAETHSNDNQEELKEKVLAIRAQAAFTLGSAVKNVGEFHSWVLEPMGDGTTTSLDVVVQALLEVSDAAIEPGSCSKSTVEYQELLAESTIHTLEAFLIGNADAQVAFSQMTISEDTSNPATILGTQAAVWVQQAVDTAGTASSNPKMSRHAIKMTARLLSLANAIVLDMELHQQEATQVKIINTFTTKEWCQAAQQAASFESSSSFKQLVFKPLQRKAKKAASTLGPYCSSQTTASQ